ncbi:MAG: DUF2278 family protein [Lachnospiraceae bacterium]|nr:DUF2278 family protein [Lachnospiraceae bacterium]
MLEKMTGVVIMGDLCDNLVRIMKYNRVVKKMNNLLKSYPVAIDTLSDDNHIYIQTVANDKDYSVGINVCSNVAPHVMWYALKEYSLDELDKNSLEYHLLKNIHKMQEGEYDLAHYENLAIDYEKQQWFSKDELQLATRKKDANNQLGTKLGHLLQLAMKEPEAYVAAFGKGWGPFQEKDRTFGFYPARGVHDVHCNRYNGYGKKKNDLKDGALFVWIPSKQKFIGVFCLFEGQC